MASRLKVDELAGAAATTITLVSGQTLDASSGTLTLPSTTVTNAQLVNSSITIGDEFSIIGGEGLDTTLTGNLLTIAGEDASTSNKGVASFSSDNFAVSSGAVTIKDGGVVTAEIADDAVTTAKINDANVTNAKLASTAVTSNKMASLVTINILASDGSTVVKTIFTPGS